MSGVLTVAFVAAILRVATPYLFASLAGVVAERVGIPNIALEGQMLTAAATGALVAGYSHSVWLGAVSGVVAGAAIGVLLAFVVIELRADPIIAGIGINLLASGATAFAVFTLLGDKGGTTGLESGSLPTVDLPVIRSIPLMGDLLSGQNVLTYMAIAALPFVGWLLYRSRFGTHLRAIGESPETARAVGLRVRSIQYASMAISGALAAFGGVFLSMGAVSFFIRDMTAGRGYIALAAVFLGGIRPVGAFLAALAFGLSEALAIQLGSSGVPTQVVTSIPYVLTLAALAWSAWSRNVRHRPHLTTRPVEPAAT